MTAACLTVLIVARNAGATIARAVRSAVAERVGGVILVDHGSRDDTVQRAREAGGATLTTIAGDEYPTLGAARQAALQALPTPFGMWLDADDELLHGRAQRVLRALEHEGAEIVADSAELGDGASGEVQSILPVPAFLEGGRAIVRQFERNYLPAPGPIAFRCDPLRALGYDEALHGAEDVDILLRAIATGARIHLVPEAGYRMYAFPGSQSRQLENQRAMYAACLRKHCYDDVRWQCLDAGLSEAVSLWVLVSMATFRSDLQTALGLLDEIRTRTSDPSVILEPLGPSPWPEGWRQDFQRGTLLLMAGEGPGAIAPLRAAAEADAAPEVLNNIGVALARSGRAREAVPMFEAALETFPGYRDALLNLADGSPTHVTSHPLRHQPNRRDYAMPSGVIVSSGTRS